MKVLKLILLCLAAGGLLLSACERKAEPETAKRESPCGAKTKKTPAVKEWSVAELQALDKTKRPTEDIRLVAWLDYLEQDGKGVGTKSSGHAVANGQPPGAKSLPGIDLLRNERPILCQTLSAEWPKACPHPPGRYAFEGHLVENEGTLAMEVRRFAAPKAKPARAKKKGQRINAAKAYRNLVRLFAERSCKKDIECTMVSSIADCDLDDLAVPIRYYQGMPLKQLKYWRKMVKEDRDKGIRTLDPRCKKDLLPAYKAACRDGLCVALPLK